ncbi:TetR/AcrR family transcriptional regulator [Leptolyngbya sp. AN02str]|uniref:TetR/AcrR family transcriptional regulator n=1 Tax=Leptolyngbya sp. AN02str TaxID=3423363 RepID=UPI003D31F09F
MPKIVDHDQYRKELLNKCFNLFAEKGYAAITMRQIAEGLQVSTGTLYHYFPNKEALFEQVVEELAQRDILQAKAEVDSGQTLGDRLHILFSYFERNRDHFFKQMLLCVDFHQHLQREGAEPSDSMKGVSERIEKSITNLTTGLLGVNDPHLVSFLMTFIDGLMLSQMYGCKPVDFAAQAQLLTNLLEAYLEKRAQEELLLS